MDGLAVDYDANVEASGVDGERGGSEWAVVKAEWEESKVDTGAACMGRRCHQ